METQYERESITRAALDALPGPTVVEFGTNWCGYCQGAQPAIAAGFAAHPDLRHLKIEDGPDRRLGRTFRVKLWPTLVLMRDGVEVARLVRPTSADDVRAAFTQLAGDAG
jgi:thioredoxin 1